MRTLEEEWESLMTAKPISPWSPYYPKWLEMKRDLEERIRDGDEAKRE